MSLPYAKVVGEDGAEFLTAFAPEWDAPLVAASDHPNYPAIIAAIEDGDPVAARDAFDASLAVATRFERLSLRVSVAHGRVYFDGDEVDDSVTRQILRFMDVGEDFRPLVRFMENVAANPSEHSRAQLFDWLRARDFTITTAGEFIGYKGVGEDFLSIHSGRAIVDGEVITGRIPNRPGAIVEMPRSDVQFDPGVGCSTGLHVGTYDYAEGYARGAMLEVRVNPRDVVSVPDAASKLRTCRYIVQRTLDAPHTAPLADVGTAEPCDENGAYDTGYEDGKSAAYQAAASAVENL